MNTKTKAPERKLIYRVTWWQIDEHDALVMHRSDHDGPATARVQFANTDSASEPGIVRLTWDDERARWEVLDMADQERSREETRAINARGFAVVRDIVRHARGRDGRGTLVRSLDDTLADDSPARPSKPIADPEPLFNANPADCVVCDYLCKHAMTPHHPRVPAASVQERF